jgi:hypothetical protein
MEGTVICRSVNDDNRPVTVSTQQFRRLPIPPARILIQPPPSKPTLINIETNIYTERRIETLPTTVLGQAVQVRATPTRYTWRYGDGTDRATTSPGAPYPDMPTAHVFRRPGTFAVTLATTFTGEFSVASGPWQPIGGTATVTSPAVSITAIERRAVLVP